METKWVKLHSARTVQNFSTDREGKKRPTTISVQSVNDIVSMPADEADQPVRGREIGADSMFGTAPVAAQMIGPFDRKGPGRMVI